MRLEITQPLFIPVVGERRVEQFCSVMDAELSFERLKGRAVPASIAHDIMQLTMKRGDPQRLGERDDLLNRRAGIKSVLHPLQFIQVGPRIKRDRLSFIKPEHLHGETLLVDSSIWEAAAILVEG
jgi:hypothetical protein